MNKTDLINSINNINDKYDQLKRKEVDNLKNKYIKENCEYNIGDIIYNVCGIIEIQKITLNNLNDIKYTGRSLKWLKGGDVTYTKHYKTNSLMNEVKIIDKKKVK